MTDKIAANDAIKKYLALIEGHEPFIELDWHMYTEIDAPYAATGFSKKELQVRYRRNGYDWDMHGTLYVPARQTLPGYSFVLIHGGGVNELDFQATPDGRPGLAAVLAAQGFQVLTPSYPGLWPRGGKWRAPITERKPFYLLDRDIGEEECRDRLLKATYQVYMQGISGLVEQHLGGHKLFPMGHSTGGPMAVDLHMYLKTAKVAGIVGWGSGACDKWILDWRHSLGLPPVGLFDAHKQRPIGGVLYRTVDEFRNLSGFEDAPELTPWGRMEQVFELGRETTPLFNPDLQVTSHHGDVGRLAEYQKATSLPMEEYVAHLGEPDARFLAGIKALLMVGENDRNHWMRGGKRWDGRQDGYMVKRYTETAKGAHLVRVPAYTHMGHWALHNEKLVYLWLWAIKSGYFGDLH